jgi:colanic acid biosynthesis protein WcaM
VDGARITNSKFSHLQGDAIEWNVAINDRNILISDHVIDNINCTNGKINWGIGIGLAGSTYDNDSGEANRQELRGGQHHRQQLSPAGAR